MGLVAGEELLILSDGTLSPVLVEVFATTGAVLQADVQTLQYTPNRHIFAHEFGLFAGASLGNPDPKLSRTVVAALEQADAVLLLTSDLPLLFNPDVRRLATGGKRFIGLPYMTEENLLRVLPDSPAEAHLLQDRTMAAAQRFRRASTARVTSPGGTDVFMSLGQYRVNAQGGVLDSKTGGRISVPAGQVSQVPDAGSVNGVVVIDRSIGAPVYKGLSESIRLVIEAGRVIAVEGGQEADHLRAFLSGLEHAGAYHFTELGVGTNPRCRHVGLCPPCEDTHANGSVSFAIGADVHLGGITVGPCHIDSTLNWATLELDGETLIEYGRFIDGLS